MARIVNRSVLYKCDLCEGESQNNSNWISVSTKSYNIGSIEQITSLIKKFDICGQCKDNTDNESLLKFKQMIF